MSTLESAHSRIDARCEDGVVRAIECHVGNATGRLDRHLGTIATSFTFASDRARELIGAEGIDVAFVDAPSDTIPEWGVGGYSYGRHAVLVALDPDVDLEERRVTATLVHEFHHAMRERGPGCGGTLGDMLVSEGLAQLFEEEVTGEAPFYSRVAITDEEIALARDSLRLQPFSQSKWFFGTDGVTRSFGYTYGYQICRSFARSAKASAASLVLVPTDAVLRHAGLDVCVKPG
jgi:hypothetical protein